MCISRRYILTYIHLGFIKSLLIFYFASFVLIRDNTRLYRSALMISSSSFTYKISYKGLPVDMCHIAVTKGRCAKSALTIGSIASRSLLVSKWGSTHQKPTVNRQQLILRVRRQSYALNSAKWIRSSNRDYDVMTMRGL
jgi:hypothetical protein